MKLPNLFVSLVIPGLLMGSLGLAGPAAAADQAAAKPDAAKGSVIAGSICQACHTSDGSRGIPANPILQGQHPEYLVKQLTEFKDGKRNNAVMKGMTATLSPEDMRNVAAFYAGKQAKNGFARDKNTVFLGERIYRGGVLERNVPACSGCHSPNGAGLPAQYPRVAGQHAEYTQAQLLAFRDGTRANGPMMTTIAGKMTDKEIKAVADYMAGLR
jgi:cytochrome c553